MSKSLWGCGFNAFGQLNYAPPEPEEQKLEHEDLHTWSQILTAEHIEFLCGEFSTNLVTIYHDSPLHQREQHIFLGIPPSHLTSYLEFLRTHRAPLDRSKIASNSASQIALINPSIPRTIKIYKNPTSCRSNILERAFSLPSEVTRIVGNLGAFHALTKEGKVYSWGDPRFPNLLGREVTEEEKWTQSLKHWVLNTEDEKSNDHPASTPSEITALSSLPTGPIRKLTSGGTLTAALTTGNDLYIWGFPSSHSSAPKTFLPYFKDVDMEEQVISVDIHGLDVFDVAVGRDYMIALTIDGEERQVWGIGSNGHGQLGLGDTEGVQKWVELEVPGKGKVEGVWTGYDNSFLVVEND